MSRLGALGLSIALALSWGAEGVTAATIREFKIGNWNAGAYSNDQTRRFSHCAANMPYRSGITMLVSVSRDLDWKLAFHNPNWQLTPGSTIPLNMTFDRRNPLYVSGSAFDRRVVIISMPTTGQFVEAFRQSFRMQLNIFNQSYEFDLSGTSRLMAELVYCTQAQIAIEQGRPPPAREQRPQTTTPARPVTPPRQAVGELQLLATRIASNFLLQARFPNARLLPLSETPVEHRAGGVAWSSDIAFGVVRVIDINDAKNSQEVGSFLIAADATACKGQFASARASNLVNDEVVTRVTAACREAETHLVTQYFIVERRGLGFVVIGFVGLDGQSDPESLGGLTDSQFQQAVARAAGTP